VSQYLCDTHAVLWYAGGQRKRLGASAQRVFDAMTAGRSRIAVSVVSLWEIALLYDEGRLPLPAGFSAWCDALESLRGVEIVPLLRGDVEEARSLGALRDPHDRLIAGTALRLRVPLVTVDDRLRADRRLRTIW
jgi:PIN domain nuclease of toxin-antitoxin system